ncbi:MAG: T9SS type A sorting domain-containing protein [Bacteroidetes bacterium]|nr:T9SS type A sorting domain-containing protein [Bacteroidota bacterium]
MNKILPFVISITLSGILTAQTLLHCGADEMRIATLKQNPEIAKAVIKRDAELENFTQNFIQNVNNNSSVAKTTTATYVIPVVFHVIHNYGPENITDAQLKDGLDIVNKTFRKQHPNNSSIVAAFQPIHADCDIEFKLAQKDPNGNCHSGINRIASTLTSSGDHRVKNLIHWPPTQYLNVYVVANAAGLAGHAIWPSDADTIPLWDGIVLSHSYVGTFGTSDLTRSVAFAHECGHYLNLQHIWGGNNVPGFYFYPCADVNKDCNIDDLVADTPPTIGWQSCNLTGASCGNVVDNVQNAMDYSYCNIMFTDGQKARMTACLNSTIAGRNNLWQTSNLVATGIYTTAPLCKADFISNKTMVCPSSSSVTFINTSYNGTFTSLQWTFAGGTPSLSSVSNPTVSYSTPGSYPVTLKVKNGTDSVITTKQNYINVQTTTGAAYPFIESFETVTSLNGLQWYTNNLDTGSTWQLTNLAASTGSTSVMIDNFNSAINGKDELYSRAINLSGASGLSINFKYAFARKDTSNKDQLQLFGVTACGGTNISRFNAIGSLLETVPVQATAFYPTQITDWKSVSATLPGILLTTGFRLKFIFSANGGNNIFIDDINIDITTGTKDISEMIQDASIFPNPTSNTCALKFNLLQAKTLTINIFNVIGEKVYSLPKNVYEEGTQEIKLNTHNLSNGMYFVQISDGTRAISKPLVISN